MDGVVVLSCVMGANGRHSGGWLCYRGASGGIVVVGCGKGCEWRYSGAWLCYRGASGRYDGAWLCYRITFMSRKGC